MKKLLTILVTIAAISTTGCKTHSSELTDSTTVAPPELGESFCVQTFNAYATAYAMYKSSRIEKLGKEFAKSGLCEIINMQELWTDKYRNILISSIAANFPGTITINADKRTQSGGMRGLTSFIHAPTPSSETFDYPINSSGMMDGIRGMIGVKKAILSAKVLLKTGQKLLVVNTHTHPSKESIRIAQIIEIIKSIATASSDPALDGVVLTGDFNAEPDSIEFALLQNVINLQDAYTSSNKSYSGVCTYCRENSYYLGGGTRVIDFVFFRSLKANRRLSAGETSIYPKKFGEYFLSDHYGVRSKLNFAENNAPLAQSEIEIRKRAAILTLNRANKVLIDENDTDYHGTIKYINGLKSSISKDNKINNVRRLMDIH